MTDMINLRAAIVCEYAANALRAASTYESAASIYGTDTSICVASRAADGVDFLHQAAELLGFTLTPVQQRMETPATEPHSSNIPHMADVALNTASALQDIDSSRPDYSNGLSGRLA